MSDLDKAFQTFINESLELTEDVEQALLAAESEEENFTEWIDSLFRAIHTIKGNAGLFGLDQVTELSHAAESVLDLVRSNQLELSTSLTELLLESNDLIRRQVVALSEGEALPSYQKICAQLSEFLPLAMSDEHEDSANESVKVDHKQLHGRWRIQLRPNRNVFQEGLDPVSFIQYLGSQGELESVTPIYQQLEQLTDEEFDPENCYLGFDICFVGSSSKQAILEAFEFIQHDADILISAPDEPDTTFYELNPSQLSTESVNIAVVTKRRQVKAAKTLRVEAEKLDQLIDLVGEMVIMGARTNLLAHESGNEPLIESMAQLERLVESIRDSSLQLRMVQIGDTFNKFKRVVRDTASELDKCVELSIGGAETELDKTFVEKLSDPLTHLVRNAIDHGIESESERVSAGKSSCGTITLNAYHDSGSIVIEVIDDGRGIDEQKVIDRAITNGLIQPSDRLTKRELWQLIFEAGFSTCDKVTDLSGRGVGMDVVKRNIDSLRGNIEVESELGVGSRFTIRLPLTLSIIDGFMFKVAGGEYVIPLDNVVECLELNELTSQESGNSNRYIKLRDEMLPYLRLSEWFGLQSHSTFEQEALIVVQLGSLRAGLVVDSLSGEFQTVVKPLGRLFEGLKGVSGATILGSGEVAIILDIFALIQTSLSSNEQLTIERQT